MDFSPGPYTPFPVSGERSETPPPDFDPSHPFTGVELIVSGLPFTSISSASEHLSQVVQDIVNNGTPMPELQIVSPSTRQPLDFVYVSLSGTLKENPRPDVLENVRTRLDSAGGLEARWKVSSGRSDKTRQAYFEIEESLNPLHLKTRFDNILRQNHHDFQSSYIPNDSNRIFYHFLNRASISDLTNNPIRIDNCSYPPRRSRYIQPIYGLEVAVNGVGDAQSAKSMIDAYLQRKYGTSTEGPVVRRSRVELDGTVYCVILSTPQITQRFLRDPFTLFENSGITTSPPQFLYLLNSNGIPPTSFNNRFSSSVDHSSQRQLDSLSAQCDAMAATVRSLADDQKLLSANFQTAQDNITRAFADSTAVYAATNLVSSSQAELTSLQQSLTTLQLMSVIAPNTQAQNTILDGMADLARRIETATNNRDSRAAELHSLQTRALPMMPLEDIPDIAPLPHGNRTDRSIASLPRSRAPSPSSEPSFTPHKRLRTSGNDGRDDIQEEQHVASLMQVDTQPGVRRHHFTYIYFNSFCSFIFSFLIFFSTALISCFSSLVSACVTNVSYLLHLSWLTFLASFSGFCPTSFSPLPLCKCRVPFPSLFPCFILLILLYFHLLPVIHAFPSSGPVSFRTIALNANGLADPMKIDAIRSMVRTNSPHAFVIGETKNSGPISSRLELNDYDLHESPGRPLNFRGRGKWGVIIGVRRGMFNVQPVPVSDHLRGRAVVLDLTIPTSENLGFHHRLIGVYAPWNPGGSLEDENLFWPEVTELCANAKYSWSLHGDLNATLLSSESSSVSLDVPTSRLAYTHFLNTTNGIDLWQTQPSSDVASNYTHSLRQHSSTSPPTFSIIDRSAVSRVGTLAGSISVLPHFIPCTDHRPIDSRLALLSPPSVHGHPNIPSEVPPSTYSPRFRFPFRSEKHRLTLFSSKVDDLLADLPSDLSETVLDSDQDFQSCYESFTQILLTAARSSFNLPKPHPQTYRKVVNPTLSLILGELRHINRLLAALSRSHASQPPSFPRESWVNKYISAFSNFAPGCTAFKAEFKSYLSSIRKKLHRLRFAEERQERLKQGEKRAKSQVYQVLHGSSSKRLFNYKISSLPLAITPQPDLEPDKLLTGPREIKAATVSYYQQLYHRTPRPPQNKPWMTTPSVRQVANSISSAPFCWPQTLDHHHLRLLLRKGNARPTPGPDGWEKWFIKILSDSALSIILKLANYIISSSHFPPCLKPTNISTIHKRGPNTILSNYRGIACNNFLLNLPFAWLNHLLGPFLTKHMVVPECQVATQPGTQGRDLVSFISQYERWASRERIPLYVLQRDQKKGFDMLEPEGFYDAIQAYGLPLSIIDLDRSSQENVPYRVKTAHGFTDPFIVNGVTKQGGSLSPLKCTLTTSLCNRWLADQRLEFPGSITISSHSQRRHRPHTPLDHIHLHLSIIEAMDDSLIPASDLTSLKRMAWDADRFQATYGWETAWPKSALYVFNTPPPSNHDARMPAVDYSNPQTDSVTWHEIPIITSHTTFLRVPINKPDLQFSHLRDLILNFSFPSSTHRFPLTVLRRIIVQHLISKIRPHLALQPISHQHALTLDHMIAGKVHEYLSFPFRFKSLTLTSPLHLRGLGFPSVSRINSSLAISGLHRDLNHHLSPFSKMAHITLADWTCSHNRCIFPLQHPYSTSITSPSRQTYIPFAWALAQRSLSIINLSLLPTDLHYIASGDVSLRHLHSLSIHHLPQLTHIPSRVLSRFEDNDFSLLSQFGNSSFSLSPQGPSFAFTPHSLSFPSAQYYLTRDLPLLLNWFRVLPSLILKIASPDPSLLLPPSTRQQIAESSILALAAQSSSFPHHSPPTFFATDASTVNTHDSSSAPQTSTTFAVLAFNNAFTASLPNNRTTGILHGEAYAIAAASILARLSPQPITIYSDHLNSIRLLTSHPSALSLKNNPARSLYRWILNIWDSMPHPPLLSHVRAHTSSLTIPSQLNRLADYLASHSNSLILPPPSLPLPTFFMDSFIPFSTHIGFIESHLFSFCDARFALSDAANLDTFHEPRPSTSCFDNTPPPSYPYTKAPSSYSMVIQLYLRSGQLDTSLSRAVRLRDDQQSWCRFGCPCWEDPHHIFIHCPHFTSLRTSRAADLLSNITTILQTPSISSATRSFVLHRVQNLFRDSDIWPARRSLYYLGALPPLFPPTTHHPQIHSRVAHECHMVSIRLAAQIWASARRIFFSHLFPNPSSRSRPSLTLPTMFSRILPPSPSYPRLSVSFA